MLVLQSSCVIMKTSTGGNVSIFGCVGWNEVTLLKFKDCICSDSVVIVTVCGMSQ
jgi:hypothetical protein